MAGSSVTLQWQAPNSWGVGCPENDNRYLLNVWDETANTWVKDSEGNDYNHKIILPPTTSETVSLSGLAGHTIAWRVIASNGTYENDGDAWNFQVAAGISGTVYLDSNNSCSTAQAWTSGGLTASLRGTSYSDAVDGQGAFAIVAPAGKGAAPLRPGRGNASHLQGIRALGIVSPHR